MTPCPMIKNNDRPAVRIIQQRFFDTIDTLIHIGMLGSLSEFCREGKFNRTKYSIIKNTIQKGNLADRSHRYYFIDIDAISFICSRYDASADFILLGKGNMFNHLIIDQS